MNKVVKSFRPRREAQRLSEVRQQVADVERANLRGRIPGVVARVRAAGERIRAERRARKVVPLGEYQRRSSAIPDSE